MKAIYYSVMSPRILTSIGTTNAYLIGFVSYDDDYDDYDNEDDDADDDD